MNQRATRIGDVVDQPAIARREGSRREFFGLGAALAVSGSALMMGNPLIAAETDDKEAKMTLVSNDSVTDAGEPIVYLNTPHPEISSAIMSIPAGATTDWMTHPVQGEQS